MGRHQRRLLQFALAYPYSWHSYGKDRSTVAAIRRLVELGFITTIDSRQFRLMVPERYFAAMQREGER